MALDALPVIVAPDDGLLPRVAFLFFGLSVAELFFLAASRAVSVHASEPVAFAGVPGRRDAAIYARARRKYLFLAGGAGRRGALATQVASRTGVPTLSHQSSPEKTRN